MSPRVSGHNPTLSAFSPADDPRPSALHAELRLSGFLLKSNALLVQCPVPLFFVFLSYHLLFLKIFFLLIYLVPSYH